MDHCLRAFKRFTKEFEYYNDYRMLAIDVATMISHDRNLQELLNTNRIFYEQWEYIKDDIYDDIVEELIMMAYTNRGFYKHSKELHVAIINEADQVLRSKLFKPVLGDKIDFHGLPDYFFEASDHVGSFNLTTSESEKDSADKLALEELIKLDALCKNFSLDHNRLIHLLSTWIPAKWGPPIPLKSTPQPIIKQVDYFDPAVYELIKKNPQLLNTLDWRIFEEMLADLLKTFGYSIELTKRTKDGGIDVIAIKADSDFGFHKYILQAKRYSKAVQVSPIRELLFLHSEQRASKCCLATTSTFTKGAKELGDQYRWTLELKDKQGILEWIERADAMKKTNGRI